MNRLVVGWFKFDDKDLDQQRIKLATGHSFMQAFYEL